MAGAPPARRVGPPCVRPPFQQRGRKRLQPCGPGSRHHPARRSPCGRSRVPGRASIATAGQVMLSMPGKRRPAQRDGGPRVQQCGIQHSGQSQAARHPCGLRGLPRHKPGRRRGSQRRNEQVHAGTCLGRVQADAGLASAWLAISARRSMVTDWSDSRVVTTWMPRAPSSDRSRTLKARLAFFSSWPLDRWPPRSSPAVRRIDHDDEAGRRRRRRGRSEPEQGIGRESAQAAAAQWKLRASAREVVAAARSLSGTIRFPR